MNKWEFTLPASVEFKKLGIQIGPYNIKVRTTSAKLLFNWLMVGEAGARCGHGSNIDEVATIFCFFS